LLVAQAKSLSTKIKEKGGMELIGSTDNLIDQVWRDARPPRPCEPVKVLDVKFAGKDYKEKIDEVRKYLEKKKSSGLVLSGLDEIMWLFNIRGMLSSSLFTTLFLIPTRRVILTNHTDF